jgi:hypothetical protein
MLELNIGRGGMKRLMEEVVVRHAETIHYSASAGIRVESDEIRRMKDSGFWSSMLEGLAGVRLRKEEVDRTERHVQEVTGWSDPVEEKTGFVEVACQNYEVLMEEKRVGNTGGAGPSQHYETQFGQRQNDAGTSGAQDKTKKARYRLSTEIVRTTNLRKVLEERILNSKLELSLREVLEIAKKEVHDSIVDLVKRKRLSTEPEPEKPVEVRMTYLEDMDVVNELAESY